MRIVSNASGAMRRLARRGPCPLSRQARARLTCLDWHVQHGQNVRLTCRHLGLSRQTFYRWKRRYRAQDLGTLEDRSSRPKKRRRPTWTLAQVQAVTALRERYPCWGKQKLAVLLRRDDAMVGRIVAYLKRTGQLVEPVGQRGVRACQRRWVRPYALRKPKDWAVEAPGDLVQLDPSEKGGHCRGWSGSSSRPTTW